MALKRTSTAVWHGGLKGNGTLTTLSGAFKDQPYSVATRFQAEDGRAGTNPEELIAAAHAGCFSMALSGQLAGLGMTAESIATTAAVSLDKLEKGWTVTKIHLDVVAKIPGGDAAKFQTAAANAKAGCPISRLLNAEITMDAKLSA
jgi:lipoyl-dependent peroxiredoxin